MKGNSPGPVHFCLRANIDEAGSQIFDLHKFAQGIDLRGLSEFRHFIGNECSIQENDSFRDLKIRARGVYLNESETVIYLPEEIWGFTATLTNGNPFHIGLCKYPDHIVLSDETVIDTGDCGLARWISFNETFNTGHLDIDDDIHSHMLGLCLLKQIKDQGVSVFIKDLFCHGGKSCGKINKICEAWRSIIACA